MTSLSFSGGDGRLLRSTRAVVFAQEPADTLFALFDNDRSVDFKQVASIIVANNFEMPPFVVVSLDNARIFVFGNLEVQLGEESLSGSGNDTWVEQEVDLSLPITSGVKTGVIGDLGLGWVAAGGFQFGGDEVPETDSASIDQSPKDDEAPERHAVAEPDRVVVEPDDADDEQIAPDSTSLPPLASPVVAESSATPIEDSAADDEWDPLADPDVDLEHIGAQEVVESAIPPPPQILEQTELPGPDIDVDLGMLSPDDPYVPDDTRDARTPSPTQSANSLIPPPPNPVGLTPPPSQQIGAIPPAPGSQPQTKGSPTIPAPAEFQPPSEQPSGRGNIRFDDGQSAVVTRGIYVGRHPTKSGLPDQYSSVTIRGEHVSRLHFELAIESSMVVVRDLGSNSGTEVEINGRRMAVPDGGMQISPGAKILFADRWALYETE